MERNPDKYVVGKVSDMQECLTDFEFGLIVQLLTKVDMHRMNQGKHAMRAVVVEEDWPMYEHVWSCIGAWVDAEHYHLHGTGMAEETGFYLGRLNQECEIHQLMGITSHFKTGDVEKALKLMGSVVNFAEKVVSETFITPKDSGVNVAITSPELIGLLDECLEDLNTHYTGLRKAGDPSQDVPVEGDAPVGDN